MNSFRKVARRLLVTAGVLLLPVLPVPVSMAADTTLSNLPLYSASNVPANLMLALSVEFPTGTVAAYTDNSGVALVTGATTFSCPGKASENSQSWGVCYFPKMTYLGYFDPLKCYKYSATDGYFKPSSKIATTDTSCAGDWSGNMLNWATMTALDEFRETLTGGTRSVDNATTTVLIRSNLNSQSTEDNFPNKRLGKDNGVSVANVAGDTVKSWSTAYIRSYGLGTKFRVANNPGFSSTGKTNGINNVVVEYNAQVSVCEKTTAEGNCTAYGSNFKPEGLIQQNYKRIRVGAAAYANTSGASNPNGVLRALLRDNGPTTYNGNGARQTNPYSEWSSIDGTLATNPAASDSGLAKGPGGVAFTKSGVINYLNQFGTNGYETFDTISELYWSALAYFMRAPLSADYTSALNASNSLDSAFPVFKGTAANASDSNDPMQYKCAANAILVIGDSHTHCDQRVPSSIGPSGSNNYCALQSPEAVVKGVDAAKYTTALGKLPLIEADGNGGTASSTLSAAKLGGANAGTSFVNSGQLSTYFIAGLAYFAHTNDVRDDLTGKQTVDTYVVDVMEPGAFSGASGQEIYNPSDSDSGPNQYWLAAKYGGFADTRGDGKPSSFLTWHTNTSTAAKKDLRPDNYFVGNRPDLIVAGLASIFSNVSTTTSLSASGPSVSPTRVLSDVKASTTPYNSPVSGFPIYTVTYFPGAWSGEVTGFVAQAAIGADVTPAPNSNTWSAQTRLDQLGAYVNGTTVGWRDLRRVFTRVGSAGKPFRWASLTATQQGYLSSDSTVLDFLRGDRSKEGASFHIRAHLLGDIVNSQATLVQGALSTSYTDSNNPGYSAFASTQANRTPVVYVGANDGMVHAFQADFSTPANSMGGGGAELWAYVPNLLFAGPNNTPKVDGLAALANLKGATTNGYDHHFYVDQTPQAADIDFDWTVNTAGTAGTKPSTNNWHTVLVGGLGKGGKGFYALDVTTVPSAPTTTSDTAIEATIATAKSLWEFTDSTMGYTFARPLIAKTRKYGWVVIATSGYNNSDGKGYLYVINAKTGTLLEKIATPSGSTIAPIGLARPSAYIKDVTDNTVEQVYAGDLQGNVWRFDLSGTGTYPAPVILAKLTDPAGSPQPITTAPRIELNYDSTGAGTRRWVFVGTGKFLDSSDLTDTQTQTMYALRDGSGVSPSAAAKPILRADLRKNNLVDNLNMQDADSGWYYDLTGVAPGTGGATERIVVDPDAVAGIFSINWGTLIPTADPCALSGAIYSAAYDSGQSNLLTAGGASVPYLTADTAITNLQMVQLPGTGKFVLLYGQTGKAPQTANMVQPGNPGLLQRTNWREMLD